MKFDQVAGKMYLLCAWIEPILVHLFLCVCEASLCFILFFVVYLCGFGYMPLSVCMWPEVFIGKHDSGECVCSDMYMLHATSTYVQY